MNREIKFRAWDEKEHRMVFYNDIISFVVNNSFADVYIRDNYDWQQYTGLKDKNGVDIFEGDIVNMLDGDEILGVGQVEYGKRNYPAFEIYPTPDIEVNALQYHHEEGDIEIIGNIYENKELLKGGDKK